MRGHSTNLFLPALLALLLAALVVPPPAAAEPQTTSDLLLPFFEVDFEAAGRTTLFSVGNSAADPLTVKAAVYSNWGIELVSTRIELAPAQVATVNLRDWLFSGRLPTRQIGPGELAHLQAALSGQASPRDNLYYGTEVLPGRAVGYVTLRVTSTPRHDALWGDYFWVDPGADFAEGELLVDIDPTSDCPGLCDHHLLRFLEGGGFDGGTKLIVWSPKRRNPSPTPLAAGALGVSNIVSVSDFHRESGEMFDQRDLDLLPVELLDVRDLFLAEPFGWIDVGTDENVYIGVRYTAEKRYSVTLQSWCVKTPPRPPKPPESKESSIRIEKATNGEDADTPSGPNVPVGQAVTWTYEVTNTGDVRLTDVLVSDDREGAVDCPKTVLAAGESMTCTKTGVAIEASAVAYRNVGTATGRDPNGKVVRDDDPSHYFNQPIIGGPTPSIDVEKSTHGPGGVPVDADTPSGPTIEENQTVTWTYVVTNSGETALSDIVLSDDKLGTIACPKSSLAIGESMTCTATGSALQGQYRNEAFVVGDAPSGEQVTDSDPSHYFGTPHTDPPPISIDIEKATNGHDADTPPGPAIPVGDPVTWTYVVTNTGAVALVDVAVTDDELGPIACPKSTLAPGESMVCSAGGTAELGQYSNIGTVTGRNDDQAVFDEDPSHYKGVEEPSIDVEKSTNGQDADVPNGPTILVGDTVTWTYVVTNDGNVRLTGVSVMDDKLGPISCPKSALAPGESMTCTASGKATKGQYRNEAWAEGTSPGGAKVEDHDPSHYYGKEKKEPSIDVEKATNGHDADLPPGPTIAEGDPVTWTYVVTNTGNVTLTDIALMDDILGTIACPKKTLLPGQSMTCTASGKAERGQYRNEAWVSGFTPERYEVEDHDPSHYWGDGERPRIDLEKATNGHDADHAPGPTLVVGSNVTWTYVVTNTGDVKLSSVQVSDDKLGFVSCPKSMLEPGESMTCTARGTARLGQYRNEGWARGTSPRGKVVEDHDPSHYFGKEGPAIDVEKSTNGHDADHPTGPILEVGEPVEWTYVVRNTGNVRLTGIALQDDKLGFVSCPKTALAPGESMTCVRRGTARRGQYENEAWVEGTSPGGKKVEDHDDSHYKGVEPKIDLEKATNGHDADHAPGPTVTVGSTVTWTYRVKNVGDVILTDVSVMDDKVGAVSCPKSTLAPGESMTCSATGTARLGQYRNEGWAEGKSPKGTKVEDHDPSHYFGEEGPAIDVEKSTNGQDADTPTGPILEVGEEVVWRYVVTNTGDVRLTRIALQDDKLGAVSCPQTALAPGESMTCVRRGTARKGQYKNEAWVEGTSPGGKKVEDHDDSHYKGVEPKIDLEKKTNGHDADHAPGPTVKVGSEVTWTYRVRNTGEVPLSNVSVMDDKIGAISCPKSSLAVGESMTCTAKGTAQLGQYRNEGWAEGTSPKGTKVEDHDPSHYFGEEGPAIDVEKSTNGHDADTPTGPTIAVGDPVEWRYVVRNTGDVRLTGISLSDDKLGAVSCPKTALDPGEAMTCIRRGTAQKGQYRNEAWVEGTSPGGKTVEDHDPSHYFGADPSIDLEKATNGHDADTPTGPVIDVGDPVEWTYRVRNTGNVRLTQVSVSDDKIGAISCPKSALAPGESMTCRANGTAQAGQYRNEGWAEGESPTGEVVEDHDPSHYFGEEPCGPCLGKVSRLTVRYHGASAANVRVVGKRGGSNDELFDDVVFPGGTFELVGPPHPNGGFDGTLGTEIDYFVDGSFHTNMHTSCSQPIGPGLRRGDFEVVRGASKQGGPLCPI